MLDNLAEVIKRGNHSSAVELIIGHEMKFIEELGRIFGTENTYSKTKQLLLEVVDKLPDKLASEMIRLAIYDSDSRIRLKGVQALYRSGMTHLNSELVVLIETGKLEFETLKWAIHILAKTEPRAYGRKIRNIARNQCEKEEVRREAIFALTNIADDKSIGVLCAILGDPNENIRQAAAWSLSKISSPNATCCLLAALEDSAERVRDWAIRGLRDLDDTRALEGLANAIRNSTADEQIRLIRLVAEKRSEILLRAITESLESTSINVRREAAWALSVTPYPPAAPVLHNLVDQDGDPQVRAYAQRAIQRIVQRDLWDLGQPFD